MLRHLANLWTEQGHHVEVLTTRSQPTFPRNEVDAGVRVERLDPHGRSGLAVMRWMTSVFSIVRQRAKSFDVLAASILQHMTAAAVEGARSRGVAVVARTEGAGPTGDVGWGSRSAVRRLIRNRGLRAHAVIAVSPEIELELRACGVGSRVHLIPNGVPVPARAWSHADADAFRRQLGLRSAATICFTGRLLTAKGLVELLDAFRLLCDRGRDVQLVLVGEGAHRDQLERHAASLGVSERVRFLGWTPDVEPYLRASDVFVLPSHVEGRSTALLEALAIGMPSVASDIAANRGLVPTELLPLVPIRSPGSLADTMGGALDRSSGWLESGARCRELVRASHSIQSVAERHLDVFRVAADIASVRRSR